MKRSRLMAGVGVFAGAMAVHVCNSAGTLDARGRGKCGFVQQFSPKADRISMRAPGINGHGFSTAHDAIRYANCTADLLVCVCPIRRVRGTPSDVKEAANSCISSLN